jgi:hypothetical protein
MFEIFKELPGKGRPAPPDRFCLSLSFSTRVTSPPALIYSISSLKLRGINELDKLVVSEHRLVLKFLLFCCVLGVGITILHIVSSIFFSKSFSNSSLI